MINLALDDRSQEDQKKVELERFKKLLRNLDTNLKEKREKEPDMEEDEVMCFSGRADRMSLIDIVIHSDVITIVNMYSSKRELNEKTFPDLSAWLKYMENSNAIKTSNDYLN